MSERSTIVLTNAYGERVELDPEGAQIVGLAVRDRVGNVADVSVPEGGSAGRTIGRYANRIAGGTFELDGTRYALLTNEGPNTLHGGPGGFEWRTWTAHEIRRGDGVQSVAFSLQSPDGDQGFPGAMECRVTFTFGNDSALRIEYWAQCEAPTVVNLTNHVYFNLRGDRGPSVQEQHLRVAASRYVEVDSALIPTGALAPVDGTPFDFRTLRPIGAVKYDCCFALDDWDGALRENVAEATDEISGRRLQIDTTEPGIQLYTGKPGAFPLETQHFPDAPNHPNFPSTVLRPGQTFASTTIYRFSA